MTSIFMPNMSMMQFQITSSHPALLLYVCCCIMRLYSVKPSRKIFLISLYADPPAKYSRVIFDISYSQTLLDF